MIASDFLYGQKMNGQEIFKKINGFTDTLCDNISHGGKQDSNFGSRGASAQGIPSSGLYPAY